MAVTVKTRKNTYRLEREEFVRFIQAMWERAQARKQAREDMRQEAKN